MKCLSCKKNSLIKFLDFKKIPLVNAFSKNIKLSNKKYKLQVMICKICFVCQLKDTPNEKKIFEDYSHFSSASKDNVLHLKKLSKFISSSFKSKNKKILEVGCNDGTLLNFLKKDFRVEGVDPAKNFKSIHNKKNIKVYYDHFGKMFVNQKNLGSYDIIIGVNVFAHFRRVSEAFKTVNKLLKTDGKFLFEVAYAMPTLFSGNFDTVYHEHVFNHTITGLKSMLGKAGLAIEKAHFIPTQGGSLRIIAGKDKNLKIEKNKILQNERVKGLNKILFYKNFSKKLNRNIYKIKNEIKKLTLNTRKKCLLVGAPARGVIFSNVCNLKIYSNILECVDDTKAKAGKYFPGLNIKVSHWDSINKKISNYDTALLLSWNYKKTMIEKLRNSKFKGKLLIVFPKISYKVFK